MPAANPPCRTLTRGLLSASACAVLCFPLAALAELGAASAMGTFGLTSSDTARLAVSHAQNRASGELGRLVTVELSFRRIDGQPVLDRRGVPVLTRLQVGTSQAGHLDLPGSLVAGPGARVSVVPTVRVVDGDAGSLVLPSLELISQRGGAPNVLSVGSARGFDPQPDPPAGSEEIEMPLATLPSGQTARLTVLNASDPASSEPHGTMTLELSFHDSQGRPYLDRSGAPVRKEVTLTPAHADSIDLRGVDVATTGVPVGIVPCVKVIRGTRGSLVTPTLEFFADGSVRTLRVANHPGGLGVARAPAAR